jgi:predicted dehydrogenase
MSALRSCTSPSVNRRRFLTGAVGLAGAAAVGWTAAPAVLRAASLKSQYRVAVIGHTGRGDYGHNLDMAWLDVPEVEVAAVADADPKGLEAAASRLKAPKSFADYRKMLDEVKPDLVSICPRWVDQHRDMLLAAVGAGAKGIFIEKPLCRNLAETDEMADACAKSKTKVVLAFQTRYSPKLPFVQEIIRSGKIGQLLEIRARGKEDARGGGEDMFVLAPHLFDLMFLLAGRPESCCAQVLQKGKPIVKADVQPGSEGIARIAGDEVHAMYRMQNGVTGYFDSVRKAGGGPRFGLWILGTKGVIEMGTNYMPHAFFLPHPSWSQPRAKKEWITISSAGPGKPEPLKNATPHLGDVAAVKDLIAAIENDTKPKADISGGLAAQEMVAAAFESQRLGRLVSLPLANREDPLGLL